MKTFIIFIVLFMCTTLVSPHAEINPRGVPTSFIIQKKRIKGYAISDASIHETRKNLQKFLGSFNINNIQTEFLIDFYINTGFAESCYVMDSIIFSIEKEVTGKALGFIQIMPNTATEVIDEVLESGDSEYIKTMEDICQRSLNISLRDLKEQIKRDMKNQLNNHEISMFIFYLKFSNRKWKDIPGFNAGVPKNTIKTQAEIWKRVWNTYLGKGTVKLYMTRVKECKEII